MHIDAIRILAEIPPQYGAAISRGLNDPDATDEEIADEIVTGMNESDRWAIAVSAVAREVGRIRRQRVRSVERRAKGVVIGARRAVSPIDVAENRRLGLVDDATGPDRLGALMQALTRREEAFVLTAELLDAAFALGDGDTATWGDATVGQHEERADNLYKSAMGTVETAKMHEDAVAMIRDAGATCLRDVLHMVKVPA